MFSTNQNSGKVFNTSWTYEQNDLQISCKLISVSSVAQSRPTLATLWTTACQACLSLTNSQSLFKLMSKDSMMPSNYLILYRPLLLLPSTFPSISIFSKESILCIREGNGNPLQCSCLENPRDRGAWWAAVYGVTQSWTWLKRLSSSSSSSLHQVAKVLELQLWHQSFQWVFSVDLL